MAINPVIPSGLLNDPCNIGHVKQFTSYEPAHLFLQFTLEKPTLVPLRKQFRGTTFECGYKTLWPKLTCVEQKEPGSTITHTFNIGTLEPGTKIWYRLSTSCSPTDPISYSPPIEYIIPPCNTTGSFCKLDSVINSGASVTVRNNLTFPGSGDPTMYASTLNAIRIMPPGTWQGYTYGRITNTNGSLIVPTLFRVHFDGFPASYNPESFTTNLVRNQTADFLLNYTYIKNDSLLRFINVFGERVSGPTAFLRFLNAAAPATLTAIKTA